MDLWIKNYENTILVKANEIKVGFCSWKSGYSSIRVNNDCEFPYETEERAQEVLSDIERVLKEQSILKLSGDFVHDNVDLGKIKRQIEEEQVVMVSNGANVSYISPQTVLYEMPRE